MKTILNKEETLNIKKYLSFKERKKNMISIMKMKINNIR